MKKTIAQQLNVKDFPFEIKDKNNREIYYENSDGYWERREWDSNGNRIHFENSNGDWYRSEWDSNSNEIYYENSDGFWYRKEYDSNGYEIYFEDSSGLIIDKRPKPIPEYTMEELTKMLGKEFKIKK